MRAHRRIAIGLAFALSFVMPATSVMAAAAPFDGQRLAVGIVRFFIELVGDGGEMFGIGDAVSPPQPGGPVGASGIDYGQDGRLTLLLLGMDSRDDTVTRTDTVMVMSLKGSEISAASIPRDTKRIPDGNGGIYGKVNSILRDFYVANGSDLDGALDSFEEVVEKTLGIEIDYHVAVWFDGFTALVERVDRGARGIEVDIPGEIYDARHHDQTGDSFGVYFPAARGYRLFGINPPGQTGNGRCDGTFKRYAKPADHPSSWCRRALPYVRTRHGSSDYIRARHQQQFIDATIDGVDRSELNGLVSTALDAAKGKWVTNFPISLESAVAMFDALEGASLTNSAVFKPPRFASTIPGQNGIEPDVAAIRAWCDEYMS
jgi:anionic cell wall polymer biosynthesis LytR-Cps2A-Psr (LCP) family protein